MEKEIKEILEDVIQCKLTYDEATQQILSLFGIISLLPCPFCGSKAEKRERREIDSCDGDKVHYDVQCTNEECYLQDGAEWNCDTFEEAAKMWNKR